MCYLCEYGHSFDGLGTSFLLCFVSWKVVIRLFVFLSAVISLAVEFAWVFPELNKWQKQQVGKPKYILSWWFRSIALDYIKIVVLFH